MNKAKQLVWIAIGSLATLANVILKNLDPEAYDERVRRGLIGTGDDVVDKAKHVVQVLEKAWKDNATLEIKKTFKWKDIKHLREYCRKWEADRDNIT